MPSQFVVGIIRTSGKISHLVPQENYSVWNRGWMDGCKCEVSICQLYFIRAFVILSEVHLNKYVCTPWNRFQSHRLPILVPYALNIMLKFIKIFDKYFLNDIFVTSLFLILIFFTDFSALSLRVKFWYLVHKHAKHALRSLDCKGFVEKLITYIMITQFMFSCSEWHLLRIVEKANWIPFCNYW